jgi:4-hydroxybenzoate polyprenyltransferase
MSVGTSFGNTLEMIRFSHSVFALPFAFFALFLAAGGWPSPRIVLWVLVAMISARSAAMAFNRIVDRRYDAQNPRTAARQLVTGELSLRFAIVFTAACTILFLVAAWQINETALLLAPLVLLVLFGYSFLKRFTSLAHFGLGLALGLSPLGAWVAGAGGLVGDLRIPLVLGLGVLTWVAGFDVIYACQDHDVDRRLGLRSIPARLGIRNALRVAALLHLACICCFALVGWLAHLGWIYNGALVGVGALLLVEHLLVSPSDLERVNMAFFTLNGVVSVVLGGAGILAVVL